MGFDRTEESRKGAKEAEAGNSLLEKSILGWVSLTWGSLHYHCFSIVTFLPTVTKHLTEATQGRKSSFWFTIQGIQSSTGKAGDWKLVT